MRDETAGGQQAGLAAGKPRPQPGAAAARPAAIPQIHRFLAAAAAQAVSP